MDWAQQQQIEAKAREAAAKSTWQTPQSEHQPWTVQAKHFNDKVTEERKRLGYE